MSYLETVETFAVNANDGTLRDECMGVYLVDKLENLGTFTTFGEHEEHFCLLSRVKTLGADDRTTTMRVLIDAFSYLFEFVGDNEELYTSAHGIHHLVKTEGRDVKHYVSVNHALPIFQYDVTRRDDENVANHDDTTERHIAILIDDGGDNVCSSRTSVIAQAQSDAASAEHRT